MTDALERLKEAEDRAARYRAALEKLSRDDLACAFDRGNQHETCRSAFPGQEQKWCYACVAQAALEGDAGPSLVDDLVSMVGELRQFIPRESAGKDPLPDWIIDIDNRSAKLLATWTDQTQKEANRVH